MIQLEELLDEAEQENGAAAEQQQSAAAEQYIVEVTAVLHSVPLNRRLLLVCDRYGH